jgi:sugar phosphate isomerase/epimerase
MNFADIGMDTATLAGTLECKLAAIARAGFSQAMVAASDIVSHPGSAAGGARAVRESGLRVTGVEALRDFEGLDGQLHAYKVAIAKSMLALSREVGCRLLVVEASTLMHADPDPERTAADLCKLATLAIPLDIRIAYKARAGSRTAAHAVAASDIVLRAGCPNLGLALDAFDALETQAPEDDIEGLPPQQIFVVQLSDFMSHEWRSPKEGPTTETRFRVFPGEGAHSERLAGLVRRLDQMGYAGPYSFDVYNEDYLQMPAETVADRARRAAEWLGETVLRRALPVPNLDRLARTQGAAL